MEEIKNRTDLVTFLSKLEMANIGIPENVELVIRLSRKDFVRFAPEQFKYYSQAPYDTPWKKVILISKRIDAENPHNTVTLQL